MRPRPSRLSEIADRAQGGEDFDLLVPEFLDAFYGAPAAGRAGMIAAEPRALSGVADAYLAAIAEHLALGFALPIPDWTEKPDRFRSEPFFAGDMPGLMAILLAESPVAFRRRQIFVSRNALDRPRDPRPRPGATASADAVASSQP